MAKDGAASNWAHPARVACTLPTSSRAAIAHSLNQRRPCVGAGAPDFARDDARHRSRHELARFRGARVILSRTIRVLSFRHPLREHRQEDAMSFERSRRGRPASAAFTTGRPVFTVDGHRIGNLKEVHGNYFKIDAPLQRDYWLSCDDVESVRDETLVMSFDDGHLDQHKLMALPSDATSTPLMPPDQPVRPVLNEDDERRQRRDIEHELAGQAGNLDPSALHERHDIPGAAPTDLPENERTRGETLSLDELLACRGRRLVDANDDDIGNIDEIYYDEATGRPEWIGADVASALGSRRVVAPVRGSYVLDDRISVPYTRSQVMDSGAGEMVISVEREARLYAHYGLPYSRDASPTGLPRGMAASSPEEERTEHDFERAPSTPEAPAVQAPGVIPLPAAHEGAGGDVEARAIDEIARGSGDYPVMDPASEIAARPTPAKPGDALPSLGEDAPAYAAHDAGEPGIPGMMSNRSPKLENPIDDAFGATMRRMAIGAAAGLAVSIPMTLGMALMRRRARAKAMPRPAGLARIATPDFAERIARSDVADRILHATGLQAETDPIRLPASRVVAHTAYRTLAGAAYATVPGAGVAPAAKGALLGGGMWLVRRLGWLPGSGDHSHSTGRRALSLVASIIWGVAVAMIVARVAHPDDGDEADAW
jgi:hypothetical protein